MVSDAAAGVELGQAVRERANLQVIGWLAALAELSSDHPQWGICSMTISIPQRKAPSAEAIDALKKLFPSGIPEDYLDFLMNHDGASLEDNMLGPDNEYNIRKFISAKNIPKEK